jgi:hypothetical protein
VRLLQPQHRGAAVAGGGVRDAGAQRDPAALVRDLQAAVELERAGELRGRRGSPSASASSPTAWASAASASPWPLRAAISDKP